MFPTNHIESKHLFVLIAVVWYFRGIFMKVFTQGTLDKPNYSMSITAFSVGCGMEVCYQVFPAT